MLRQCRPAGRFPAPATACPAAPDQYGERQRCHAGHLQQRLEATDEGLARQRRQGFAQRRAAQRVDERYQRCLARAGKR
ncbi:MULTISPECIES: hypothetical protein [unclassified Pseudomonas]|uniref:hypothetical protein n=1 Tax=unclassified Pseudomonas TaxID=196821 RepID=UPI00136591D2|nr:MULTISPECIES: hypothetical protein [unclassified Pseudomonas]QOF83058.1 hypothetical protein IG194_21100 [Pseudomonas sp. ADPe]